MKQVFLAIDKVIDLLTTAACCLLLSAIVIVGGLNVFYRYVLNDAFVWSDEFLRYAYVWLGFLAGYLTVKKDGHICIDEFVRRLNNKMQFVLYIFTRLCCVVYLCALVPCGIRLMSLTTNSRAAVLPITFNYIYAAVPVGAVLMLWAFLSHAPGQAMAILERKGNKE